MDAPLRDLHPFQRSFVKELMDRRPASTPPKPVSRVRKAPVVIFLTDAMSPDWAESSAIRTVVANQLGFNKPLQFYDLSNLYEANDYMYRMAITNHQNFIDMDLDDRPKVCARERYLEHLGFLRAHRLSTAIASDEKPLLLRIGWQHYYLPESLKFLSYLDEACQGGIIPMPSYYEGDGWDVGAPF